MREGFVIVGRVTGAHGLRGQLKVRWLGDGPDHLVQAETVWLAEDPGDAAPARFTVRSTGSGPSGVRLELAEISTREQAEARKGNLVLLEPEQLEELGEDEFYWHQLVGCRVEAQGRAIGVVRSLMETGAHDVLVVEDGDGRQQLIPTAPQFVTEIDLEARRIEVALVPGLLIED